MQTIPTQLQKKITVIFHNDKGDEKTIQITADELLDSTRDDLYDKLEVDFCDNELEYEDFIITGLKF